MNNPQDKKNEQTAFLVSLGLHASLFLTFFFLVSWRAPYPPAPEYGVVLNYGLDDQGGGEIQPEAPVGNSNVDDKNSEPTPDDKSQQDVTQETPQKEDVKEDKSEAAISDEESPVTVKTEKKKIEDKPAEKVEKVEPKKDTKSVKEENPVVKKEAIYTPNTGTKKGETSQSQGDDPGKVGDKGNPEGKLDAKALYGKPGGGGGGDGFGLAMTGWAWASTPKIPELPASEEDGRIVFEIECDEEGDIVGITTVQRGLSAKAEQLLKDELRKNSLIRTSNGKAPTKSKGQVVFVLKTK